MSIPKDQDLLAKIAVKESCIPLLYGSEGSVRKTARELYRRYRLYSYALLKKGSRRSLFSPFYLTRISASYASIELHASFAVHFFKALDPSAVPVLIDCSAEGLFLNSPPLSAKLESHCFLSDHTRYKEIPPFCYLSKAENDRKERSHS